MSAKIVAAGFDGELSDEQERVLKKLQERFAKASGDWQQATLEMVVVVKECKAASLPLNWIAPNVLRILERIADGHLLLGAYEKFGSEPVFKYVQRLPMSEQRRLADGGKIKVLTPRPNGPADFREVDPLNLGNVEMKQVFDPAGFIRNQAQQVSHVEGLAKSHLVVVAPEQDVTVNRRKGVIVVRGVELSVKDLSAYLNQLTS